MPVGPHDRATPIPDGKFRKIIVKGGQVQRFVGLGRGPDMGVPERSPGHPSFSCPPWVGLVHTTNLRDDGSLRDTFVQIKKDALSEKNLRLKKIPLVKIVLCHS